MLVINSNLFKSIKDTIRNELIQRNKGAYLFSKTARFRINLFEMIHTCNSEQYMCIEKEITITISTRYYLKIH